MFWDFDGTIIHPNESFLNSLQMALKNEKYEIPIEKIRSFLRTVCSWNKPEITYIDKTGQQWWHSLFEQFNIFYAKHNINETDNDKINVYFKKQILDFNSYTLYDHAKTALMQCIQKGYRNYIISNNYPELPLLINDFGLSPYFTDYFISSNIGYEKPRIEIFQYALQSAGFPDCCYMIGDIPIADIQGGKLAGMKTILVHQDGDFNTDYKCKNLSEIPLLLAL